MKSLRICIDCGLHAHTETDIKTFVRDSKSAYGHQNLCKKCHNNRQKRRLETDDRFYLSRKFISIKKRCYSPKDSNYKRYGNRGINICQEWLDSPEKFVDWALTHGWKRGLQIDRIDSNGHYALENCRWVASKEQNRNRRIAVTDWDNETRICYNYKGEKPLEEFYRNRGNPLGRAYECRNCASPRDRKVIK